MLHLVHVTATAAVIVLSLAGSAAGTLWHVPSEVPTIAGALAGAAAGDTVLVACGTYYEHDVQLKPGVSLIGTGGGPLPCTIIDAQGLGDVLIMMGEGPHQVVMNLCLWNGHTGISDIGLYDGSVDVINCRIEGNTNGVENQTHGLRLLDCVVAGNTGRGVFSNTGAGLRMERCRVFQNLGGAIAGGEAPIRLFDCLITQNHAVGDVISLGGPEGHFVIEGCTIARNSSTGSVIAFDEQWSTVYLTRTIIAENDAPAVTGVGYLVPIELSCCDIWHNDHGSFTGTHVQYTGPNNSEDPRFCDPAGGDFRLAAGSPCLPENSGPCGLIGALGLGGCGDLTSVPEAGAFGFTGVSPNPFNPRTTMVFALEEPGEVDLALYDLAGRRVRTLISGERRQTGTHEAVWDGRDELGRVQPAGLYVCRLRAGQSVDSRTVVLLK